MRRKLSLAALCLLGAALVAPQTAEAVPIRTLPNLNSVTILETTGGNTALTFAPNDAVLTTRLNDRLSSSNSDHNTASNEFYDFYYSDAAGNFDIDGMFLTITAVFDNATDGGLNIAGASLQIGADVEFASSVSSFFAVGSFAFPGTVGNALGDTPGTTTFLGDTLGQPDDVRLSLTLGFASTSPASVVPEHATMSLFVAGLASLAFLRRRRGRHLGHRQA